VSSGNNFILAFVWFLWLRFASCSCCFYSAKIVAVAIVVVPVVVAVVVVVGAVFVVATKLKPEAAC